MRTRIALVLTVGLLSLLGCRRNQWIEFHSPDASFTVSMPGRPREIVRYEDFPSSRIKRVDYTITTNEVTFMVSYTDYPKVMGEDIRPDEMLDRALDRSFSRFPDARKVKSNMVFQGFPCRAFTIEDLNTSYVLMCRSFMVGDRLYLIQVVKPSDQPNPVIVNRFFDSFRIEKQNPK